MQAASATERLLDGLDPAQLRAVVAPVGPIAVWAGAGSGKTRVLTRRIAYRSHVESADPRYVLALTFTRRAAAELRDRLTTFGLHDLPTSGTFHAVAYAQLRGWWTATGQREPALLDRKGRLLSRIVPAGSTARIGDVAAEIEWARALGVGPDDYPAAAVAAGRSSPLQPEAMAEHYRAYQLAKRRKGLVDFDDLLERCAHALENDAAFARGQRWRFRHLFVDEYQDVNPLQHRLLRAWLGDRTDICVVGDPNQAIYGWNGADARFLTGFEQEFPGAQVIRLDRNHRSSPGIVSTASVVLAENLEVQATRSPGPTPRLTACPDDQAEALHIARAVRAAHRPGRPWSDQGVLVRTNAQTALIEQALKRSGIPFRVRGAAPFLERPEVAETLNGARDDATPLRRWLGDLAGDLATQRSTLAIGGETDDESLGVDDAQQRERIDSLETLVRLGQEFLADDPDATVAAFPRWLTSTLRSEDSDDQRGDAVDVVTFHASKGLEWKVVHVAGLEDGYVPISPAKTRAARDEERRLLYVALTRASDELNMSWAAQRTFGQRMVARSMSPWLPAVELELARLARSSRGLPRDEHRRHAAAAHAALETSTAAHTETRAISSAGDRIERSARRALREWRHRAARAAGVPDAVVLSDRALHNLAHLRPTDADGVAAVPGLGVLKANQYSAELLSVLAAVSEEG